MKRYVALPLARRIDRLARAAHRFHRFAHHPLCRHYAGELVALGRKTRVCRGCLFTLLGALTGAAVGLWRTWPSGGGPWPALLAVAIGAASLALRGPRRPSKLASRWAPAGLAAFGVVRALQAGPASAATCLALVAVGALALLAHYRRRGPDRSACAACPERLHQPCSGVAPIVRRERAFRRVAGRWLVQ